MRYCSEPELEAPDHGRQRDANSRPSKSTTTRTIAGMEFGRGISLGQKRAAEDKHRTGTQTRESTTTTEGGGESCDRAMFGGERRVLCHQQASYPVIFTGTGSRSARGRRGRLASLWGKSTMDRGPEKGSSGSTIIKGVRPMDEFEIEIFRPP